MNRRLARLALGLYPLAFRRRYGQEMCSLLDETPARAGTVLDLVRGALFAHVRPPAALSGYVAPADRLRASASGVLACWVVFAAAGFGFYKTTEGGVFAGVGHAHFLLRGSFLTVQGLAAAASLAVILGAAPSILAVLARARREPAVRRPVSVAILAVLGFAGLTGIISLLASPAAHARPTGVGGIAFIAWGLAGLACAEVCVIASRRALFAVPMSGERLIAAFAGGALVTAAMAAITVAVAIYAVALPVDVSHLAGTPNGPLQAISVSASLVIQVVVMAAAAALATATTLRGWRAAWALRPGA
jgi:hypothetical protein